MSLRFIQAATQFGNFLAIDPYNMMAMGVLEHSRKVREVNEFDSVVHLSCNVIASTSLLLGLGICLPVT